MPFARNRTIALHLVIVHLITMVKSACKKKKKQKNRIPSTRVLKSFPHVLTRHRLDDRDYIVSHSPSTGEPFKNEVGICGSGSWQGLL